MPSAILVVHGISLCLQRLSIVTKAFVQRITLDSSSVFRRMSSNHPSKTFFDSSSDNTCRLSSSPWSSGIASVEGFLTGFGSSYVLLVPHYEILRNLHPHRVRPHLIAYVSVITSKERIPMTSLNWHFKLLTRFHALLSVLFVCFKFRRYLVLPNRILIIKNWFSGTSSLVSTFDCVHVEALLRVHNQK